MTYRDHGAYTPPSEPPLAFDARQPVRGASPLPTTLFASAVLLAIVAGGGFLLLRHGSGPLASATGGGPPAVGAQVGQTRAAPPASAQPQDATAGLQIYRTDAPQPATPTMTPPPEAPTPRPTSSPPQIALAQASPADTVTLAPPPAPAASTSPHLATVPEAPARAANVPPRISAPAPTIDSLVEAARRAPPTPRARLATAPAPSGGLRTAVAAPETRAPAAPRVAAAPSPTPGARAAAGASVQIGAFSSNALAQQGWTDATRLSPSAAAHSGRRIETVESNGHTLYRTFVTFASHADAVSFCDQLQTAGRNCFVR